MAIAFRMVVLCIVTLTMAILHTAALCNEEISVTNEETSVANEEISVASERVETIEVVGQKLKQIHVEDSTPISVIHREKIEASGASSLGDLLRDTIELDGVASENVYEPNSGRSVLMGLHSAPVLALLNGNLFITGPGSLLSPPGADISMIPLSAIERIEILKDSVAAIYGGGAIGGVVNIITRKEGDKGEVLFNHSQPNDKGGAETQFSASKNFSGHRYAINTSLGYSQAQSLIAGDRDYIAPIISNFAGYPTRFDYDARETPIPMAHRDCEKGGISSINSNTGYCEMNIAPLMNIIPEIKQYSGLINMNYKWTPQWNLVSTALFSQKKVHSLLPPSPGVIYASDIPDFFFRFFESGHRSSAQDTTFYDINISLNNDADSGWSWRHHMGFSSSQFILDGKNFLHAQEVSNLYDCRLGPDFALEEGDCDSGNYFDPFANKGERGDLSSALREPHYEEQSALFSVQSHVEGETSLGLQPIELSGGLQLMRDLYSLDAPEDSYLLTPQFDDVTKKRQVTSALFGVGSLFFDSKLKVDLNLRWDSYNDFGSSFSSRLAAFNHVSTNLLVRGSLGRSFQAPSLLYRYGPTSNLFANIVDKVACEEAKEQERNGDERASYNIGHYCTSQTIPTNVVSNKELKLESADTMNLGVLLNPHRNFHVGLDWWYLERNNYIGPILSDGTKLEHSQGKEAEFPESVFFERRFNGISGVNNIIQIDTTVTNLIQNKVSGLDLSTFYRLPFVRGLRGEISILNQLTYTLFNKMQPFAQLGIEDRVGFYGYPPWKNNLRLSWAMNPWGVSLFLRSYAGQKQENKEARSLPSHSELDLTMSLQVLKTSFIHFGGKNILATRPPTQDSQVHRFNGSLYSLRGPRLFFSYKYLW